jgi:hypothetical protein
MRERGYEELGWMISVSGGWRNPNRNGKSIPFALDNGQYHAPDQPPKGMKLFPPFYEMVKRCIRESLDPLFIVAPDVPYHGDRTRELSRKHRRHLREYGWQGRIAIAVQDGMGPDDLDGYQAVFVGGSTEWKWRTAEMWCSEARARGMWSHVARVNTRGRIRHCIDIGADSADGTGIWRGDRAQLSGVLQALCEGHLFIKKSDPVP